MSAPRLLAGSVAPSGLLAETADLVPLDALVEHPDNPRDGDLGAVYESIAAHGFWGVVVRQQSTGYVLVGNHRTRAARLHRDAALRGEPGARLLTHLPVQTVDVTDAQARRILLADNRANDRAHYHEPDLAALLQALHATPEGLAGTLYDAADLDDLVAKLAVPDPASFAPPDASGTADDGLVGVSCRVARAARDRWRAHVTGYATEAEAFAALLDAAGATRAA